MKTHQKNNIQGFALALIFGMAAFTGTILSCSNKEQHQANEVTFTGKSMVNFAENTDHLNAYIGDSKDTAIAENTRINMPYLKVADNRLSPALASAIAQRYIQKFVIDSDEMETVEARGRTYFHFPSHCFIKADGKAAGGLIEIGIVEARDVNDFAALGLATMTLDHLLATQGMFYIMASQNGERLKVDPKKPILIQLPNVNFGNMTSNAQQLYTAVTDSAGGAVFQHVTEEEVAPWDVEGKPELPAEFKEEFGPIFSAYKCFDQAKPLLGKLIVPVFQHLQKLAADTNSTYPTPKYVTEAQILKAQPRVSKLEKNINQTYVLTNDKLFTRDRKSAIEAEKLMGTPIRPVTLKGSTILTEKEAQFYNLTPAIETADRVNTFVKKHLYIRDNKRSIDEIRKLVQQIPTEVEKAPKFQTEEQVLTWFKTARADEKPVYLWLGDRLLANYKAVRLIAPTFVLKNEALHDGKLMHAKFKNAGLNARFVDYTKFLDVVIDLKADLNNPQTLEGTPKNIPFDQLTTAAQKLATYRNNSTGSEKNLTEFFWYKGRFYVGRTFLEPLLAATARRIQQPIPKMNNFELMEEMANVYHRSELKNGYLKQNYFDMTVAVNPEVNYTDIQREDIYEQTEAQNYARKNDHIEKTNEINRHIFAMTYHEDHFCYAIRRCGWFAIGEEINPKMLQVKGNILGKEMDMPTRVQVICPELKLHITATTKKGTYQINVPAQKSVLLVAVSGTKAQVATQNLAPRVYMATQRVVSTTIRTLPELSLKPLTNIEASYAFAGM